MPTAERDPLSARWDATAAKFVTRVLAANGAWVETVIVAPGPRVTAWALARGIDPMMIFYKGRGSGIETAYERAFRRACYYDKRINLHEVPYRRDENERGHQARNPDRVAALKFRWGPRTARGRIARAQAFPVAAASKWANRERPYHDRGWS